jgi:hypothetical protein
MNSWKITWNDKYVPVEMRKYLAMDSHGDMEVYMAECDSPANPGIIVRGFGLDEDFAILDLYRDIHRRMT